MRCFVKMLLCFFLLQSTQAFTKESDCMFQDNCEQCLSTHINCTWCTDKEYEVRYRCLTRPQLLLNGCNAAEIYENEPQLHTLKDMPVKDYESVDDRAVQVQPQKLFIKLVKSQPQRMKLTYRPATNHPLDLYFLMDLTWTMRDDKETLVQLGAELSETLRSLTTNYRLGFGSFADKPAMPMIMPHLTENPCAPEHEVCEPTYGYRHHLPLTEHVQEFVHSVNASRITGNLDNLEGGLDALMQTLVCPSLIGWKEEARKMVILVTDGFMHFAGDGLLAGITKRNDKQCHMSAEGEYLGSLEYDYPSLEEIYRELLRRKVSVIFAVTSAVASTYHKLSSLMREISNVEILKADSSNILELIKKSYQSFIARTQFTDNSPSYIKMDYETDCGGQTSGLRKRNYCNNLELGTETDFYITLTLTDFPKDGVYTHTIRVEEASLNEYLEIEVEIQKPCPCAASAQDAYNENGRFQCTDQGYMTCGMCQCDEGWSGTFCNCPTNSSNANTTEAIEKQCRQPLESTDDVAPVCWNRGECDCGTCACFEGFMGKYCECTQCDGYCDPERADCICGQCICKFGWSGNDCNCNSNAVDGCIGPTGEICSERGYCECNECICDEPYLGRFCEIDSEKNKLCTFYEPCVTCLLQQKLGLNMCENLSEICSSAQEKLHFTYAFTADPIDAEVRCLVRLENKHHIKCDHFFTYQSLGPSENYLMIQVNACEPVDYYELAGFVSIGTFLLGLLVICLLWGCVRIKDKREFARFEQDQHNSILMESPIYKDPIGRYKVPQVIKDDPFY